jgi:hypothetical protein
LRQQPAGPLVGTCSREPYQGNPFRTTVNAHVQTQRLQGVSHIGKKATCKAQRGAGGNCGNTMQPLAPRCKCAGRGRPCRNSSRTNLMLMAALVSLPGGTLHRGHSWLEHILSLRGLPDGRFPLVALASAFAARFGRVELVHQEHRAIGRSQAAKYCLENRCARVTPTSPPTGIIRSQHHNAARRRKFVQLAAYGGITDLVAACLVCSLPHGLGGAVRLRQGCKCKNRIQGTELRGTPCLSASIARKASSPTECLGKCGVVRGAVFACCFRHAHDSENQS